MDTIKLAKILKALSHPNRLELYLEIAKTHESSFESGKECPHVCLINEVMERLNIGAPTVSHHLKELANADLIITERQGKYLVARINEDTICQVIDVFSSHCRK
jgi:DNA-binding transcriptional ArsR family regulator